MTRIFFFLTLGLTMVLSSCNKNDNQFTYDPVEQAAIDRERILQYLDANNIDAEEHESGLFYVITEEGTGENPTVNNEVTVTYKGYLLDGTVFDETTGEQEFKSPLNGLIAGWQIGIPLFKKGGAGTLFIPSTLGYGPNQVGFIPPNSVLIFDIELLDFE